jgi:hypothetical protein
MNSIVKAAIRTSIGFGVVILVTMLSCSKGGSSSPTPPTGGGGGSVPTLAISTPTAGQIFFLNDTVRIAATATSPFNVYGYTVRIKRITDNSIVFSRTNNTQASGYNILEKWKNPLNTYTELEAEVALILDTANNKMTRSVIFHVH